MIANLYRKIFGIAAPFKRNRLGEIEVLIHKDARHHAAHGFIVASSKALKVKKAPVAVVFPDLEDAPELTHTVMTDLWEAMISQGWVPHHIAAWGTVGVIASNEPAGADEHMEEGFQTAGFATTPPAAAEIPAYLRKASQQMNAESQSVLTFPRSERATTSPVMFHPTVKKAIEEAKGSLVHLDTMAREAAAVRFESIANNGTVTGMSPDAIEEKILSAATLILQTHARNNADPAELVAASERGTQAVLADRRASLQRERQTH